MLYNLDAVYLKFILAASGSKATKPGRRGLYVRGLFTNIKQILYSTTFYHPAGVKPATTDFFPAPTLALSLDLENFFRGYSPHFPTINFNLYDHTR